MIESFAPLWNFIKENSTILGPMVLPGAGGAWLVYKEIQSRRDSKKTTELSAAERTARDLAATGEFMGRQTQQLFTNMQSELARVNADRVRVEEDCDKWRDLARFHFRRVRKLWHARNNDAAKVQAWYDEALRRPEKIKDLPPPTIVNIPNPIEIEIDLEAEEP